MKHFKKVILILIALMLSTMQYQQTKHACYRSDVRSVIPRIRTFTGDLTTPVIKYRVLSTWIAKQFVFAFAVKGTHKEKRELLKRVMKHGFQECIKVEPAKNGHGPREVWLLDIRMLFEVISWWTFAWLLLTMLIPIFYSRMPLIWILALFAMVQYHWLPGGRDFVFPYDGPILFMTTLTMLVLHKYMPVAIVGAMAFKETALAMVFTCKKTSTALISAGTALATKAVIDLIVGNPLIFTAEPTIRLEHDLPCIVKNIHLLSNPHVLMMLALIGIGCIYVNNRVRLSVAFYVACMLLVGVISEYRIWFECLIIIMWGIEQRLKGE